MRRWVFPILVILVGLTGGATSPGARAEQQPVEPRLVWRFGIGTVEEPVITAGKALVPTSDDGLIALDLATGAELWRFQARRQPLSPAVVSGMVALVTGTPDGTGRTTLYARPRFDPGDHHVYGLDATTGRLAWEAALNGQGTAVIGVGDDAIATADTGETVIVRHAVTGQERWRFAAPRKLASITAGDGMVFVSVASDALYAFDAATGAERWRMETRGTRDGDMGIPGVVRSVVVSNGLLYGVSHDDLFALETATGAERWHVAVSVTSYYATLRLSGQTLYAAGASGELDAFDAASGAHLWRTGVEEARSFGLLVADSGIVLALNGEFRVYDPTSGTERRRLVAGGWYEFAAVSGNTILAHFLGMVHAIDAVSGREVWRYGDPAMTRPVVVSRVVVAGFGDGSLVAVDAATGGPRWRIDLGIAVWRGDAIAVSADAVFAVTDGGTIFAVEAATGAQRWRTEIVDSWFGGSRPVVAGGVVVVSDRQGLVVALDEVTGAERWRIKLSDRAAPLAGAAGSIYAGHDRGTVTSLDAATGDRRWSTVCRGDDWIGTIAATSTVVVTTCEGALNNYDATTGAIRWRFPTSAGDGFGGATIADDLTLAVRNDGYLYAFNTFTGAIRWRFAADRWLDGEPQILGDRVFLGSSDGYLYAIDAVTAGEQWRFPTRAGINSPPVVAGELVCVVSGGTIYAVER